MTTAATRNEIQHIRKLTVGKEIGLIISLKNCIKTEWKTLYSENNEKNLLSTTKKGTHKKLKLRLKLKKSG